MMTDEMAKVIREVKPLLAVVVTPMPRYLDPCCEEHEGGKTEDKKPASNATANLHTVGQNLSMLYKI